jgi:short-subunit dehydrogenase
MEKSPTAIITGASTGLGLELSVRLAAEGYFVIGVARHRPKDARWTKVESAGSGRFIEADVSNEQLVSEVISVASQSGNYNLLINCAGQGVFGASDSYSMHDVSDVFSGNLFGLILFCAKSLPLFVSKSGTIVNVMSTASHVGRANESIYCAAKWGARGYTEALRVELKGKPVRIVAAYPGGMKTPFWEKAKGHSVNPEKFMDPAEVADELIFALRQKRTIQVTDIFFNRA